MRKLLFISMLLGSVFISPVVMAVDGYKELKFGMTKSQVVGSNLCTLDKQNSGVDGIEFYSCDDFMFGGATVEAGAFFIGGKFLRFVILPPLEVATGLMNGLSEKYGSASSSSTDKEFNAIDNMPNREAYLAFDKDTIFLKISSDENYVQQLMLLYTSPIFDILVQKIRQKSISKDL